MDVLYYGFNDTESKPELCAGYKDDDKECVKVRNVGEVFDPRFHYVYACLIAIIIFLTFISVYLVKQKIWPYIRRCCSYLCCCRGRNRVETYEPNNQQPLPGTAPTPRLARDLFQEIPLEARAENNIYVTPPSRDQKDNDVEEGARCPGSVFHRETPEECVLWLTPATIIRSSSPEFTMTIGSVRSSPSVEQTKC